MPTTTLYVASATIAAGSKWLDVSEIVGEADELYAAYSASEADSAALALVFDTAAIPENATIGTVAVRLRGSWSGVGEPAAVVVSVGNCPNLEFFLTEAPDVHEASDPAGWGMIPATLNALEGTLSLTTADAEVFSFDSVEVTIDWEEPAPPPAGINRARKAGLLGLLGYPF